MTPAPLRIAYLGHTASLSGGEIAFANLISALDDVDAHVLLAEDGPMVDRFRAVGATVDVVPLTEQSRTLHRDEVTGVRAVRPAVDAVRYASALAGRIRRLRPDLVHTISLKSALYGGVAARFARVPVVWSIQDRIAPDYLPGPVVTMVRAAARVLPTAIIANSAATAETLHPGGPGRVPVDVVHPAVPTLPAAPPRTAQPYRVGVLGRLSPWKGQRVFLDAFAKAFAATDAEARLIGAPLFEEEDFEAELRDQVDRLGLADRVELRGHREDVVAELADLDAVVHCSTVPEPFGQVVVEAMGVGRPVIAAAAGGPLEIVTEDVDGLLTPPGDVDALAAAMVRLAEDPALAARLVSAGRETARRFAPEVAAEMTMGVYHRVTARRSR